MDMGATSVHVFRDDPDSFSADIRCVGREAPRNIEEAGFTPFLAYSVTLCMTYGRPDAVGVMVECSPSRNRTGETSVMSLVTEGSDAIEPICQEIGIQSYV